MANLDDGPDHPPLEHSHVRASLLSLVPREHFDLISPRGEYTRHLRHDEVSRSVMQMWACGEIQSNELWLFAYDDEDGLRLPRAESDADVVVELSNEVWGVKRDLLTRIYGFVPDSWEVQANPRRAAFWRISMPEQAWARLERGRLPQ